MVLREGWDVQNVVAIVGLRPYTSKARILPEQTLGRGLRRMFREENIEENIKETLSVVGTDAFIDFVESIKSEGVELDYEPMDLGVRSTAPLVVDVDRNNSKKDIERLDIEMPILSPRVFRNYKDLGLLNVDTLPGPRLPLRQFTPEQQREIVFRDIDTEKVSHTTVMDLSFSPTYQSVVGYFTMRIFRDLHLVGGREVLFGKIKKFIEERLFTKPVDLNDLNVLRNLSEIEVTRAVIETFKTAINALTVQDSGTTEIRDKIKLSKTRPFVVNNQAYVVPKKSIFNKIVGDSGFELEFAAFLDECPDIISFVKNSQSTGFRMEYKTSEGGISNYYPDFLVKETDKDIWIIETKGREDTEDPGKWERLKQWCEDATARDSDRRYHALFVRQEQWQKYRPRNFKELCKVFAENKS
jgi:type III restriction enzyme